MAAQALWCRYPGEIAADLSRYHHRRIADWHAGVMASQELLELCEHMDDDGAFKMAWRGGEPSQQRRAVLQIANELAVLRAAQVPGADGDQWGSQLFFTPAQMRELVAEHQQRAGGREAVMAIGARNTTEGGD